MSSERGRTLDFRRLPPQRYGTEFDLPKCQRERQSKGQEDNALPLEGLHAALLLSCLFFVALTEFYAMPTGWVHAFRFSLIF